MRIFKKLKHRFRRKTPTAEELAVRAQAKAASAEMSIQRGEADIATLADRLSPPPF